MENKARLRLEWVPGVLAALALAGLAVAFAVEIAGHQRQVVAWARRDLASRAELAAANLARPLRTQDLRAVQAFATRCADEGLRLTVRTRSGGLFFDSKFSLRGEEATFAEQAPCGDFTVTLALPPSRVFAPFRRAVIGFCLAGLVGVAAVLLFFFVVYRQRVRLKEMARLERFRADFIADVSHEIKTPLTGILGAVELLDGDCEEVKVRGEGEGEGRRRSVLTGLIRKESQRLNALVQSILDLARLEREGEVLTRVETDLASLVRETIAELTPRAETAGVKLTVDLPAAAPVLAVDPQLVAQALSNLIVNAIRHSGAPEVVVRLRILPRGARVEVEDHGVGIPPVEAARVFERFRRLDPSRAAESGGAGLGLAIVRRIARLHGGEASFAPAHPHGSIFAFDLNAAG